jgi:hypothetical protein
VLTNVGEVDNTTEPVPVDDVTPVAGAWNVGAAPIPLDVRINPDVEGVMPVNADVPTYYQRLQKFTVKLTAVGILKSIPTFVSYMDSNKFNNMPIPKLISMPKPMKKNSNQFISLENKIIQDMYNSSNINTISYFS